MADKHQVEKDRLQAQRELGQQLAKFARQLNEGKTGMIDRFGAKVDVGDYLLYRPSIDLIFEVTNLVPVMDMTRPPGTLRATLSCTTDVEFVAGVRAMTLVRCGTQAKDDAKIAELTPPGTQKAAEVETVDAQAQAEAIAEPTAELSDPKPVDDELPAEESQS